MLWETRSYFQWSYDWEWDRGRQYFELFCNEMLLEWRLKAIISGFSGSRNNCKYKESQTFWIKALYSALMYLIFSLEKSPIISSMLQPKQDVPTGFNMLWASSLRTVQTAYDIYFLSRNIFEVHLTSFFSLAKIITLILWSNLPPKVFDLVKSSNFYAPSKPRFELFTTKHGESGESFWRQIQNERFSSPSQVLYFARV